MKNSYDLFNGFSKILRDILKQILIIFLYIYLSLGLQVLFISHLHANNKVIINIVSILIELIILTVFVIIFRKKLVPEWDDFKKNGKSYINKFFSYYIIGLVIMVISCIIIGQFISIPTVEGLNRNYVINMPIYSILAMTIMTPIVEECMTRAILKDTFKYSIIYYFLSGLIFGTLHMLSATNVSELLYIIPYGSLGFVFAMMYKKSNNIWTNIFFHSLHNLVAILIILIGI